MAFIAAGVVALIYEQAADYRRLATDEKKVYRVEMISLLRAVAIGWFVSGVILSGITLLAGLGSAP